MIRTRVGYAGGQTADPDYGNMGDHTEAVQVDYDPRRVTYADLLRFFWEGHHPGQYSWKRQYMNAIFYHDDHQRQLGLETKADVKSASGRTIRTEVLPLRAFYLAEDYHQKYLLKRNSHLANEMTRIYPLRKDFVGSTAVARINGYAGGYGDDRQLEREIERLGLSTNGRQLLLDLVEGKKKRLFN